MSTTEKLRIAIIGGGIGGLTLSAAIGHWRGQRDDLEIDIFEASSHISEIGAGINFWPRSWEIMKAIGLEEKLLGILPQAPDNSARRVFEFRKGDQPEGMTIQDTVMMGGSYRFRRADIQQVLLNSQSGRIHLSHRLTSYEEKGEEICLHFEGGTTATCDLLVGMDGIKSVIRRCFLTKQGLSNSPSLEPVWSGDIAYRALIPMEKLKEEFPGHRATSTPMIYTGKSKHLVAYPVSQDSLVNFVAIVADPSKEGILYDGPTVIPSTQEEVLSTFKLWEKEAQALIRCMVKPTKWIIRFLQPLDRYSLGRVVLAGDAAHAMTPHQGAGAGQAIEDAYILATLICDKACTKDTIPEITEIYNTIRRPMGNSVVERSRTAGRLCQLLAPGFEDIVEGDDQIPIERLQGMVQEFGKSLEWVWKESAETNRQRALSMLRDLEMKKAL